MRIILGIPGRIERFALHGEWGDEYNGAAYFTTRRGVRLAVLFTNGGGWEHVSVSHRARVPTWDEMCEVRDAWWPDDAWVMQLHPPVSEYVNFHPNCLHLWRPTEDRIPTPSSWMAGPRKGESLEDAERAAHAAMGAAR